MTQAKFNMVELKKIHRDYQLKAIERFNARMLDLDRLAELQGSRIESPTKQADMQNLSNAMMRHDHALKQLLHIASGLKALIDHADLMPVHFPKLVERIDAMVDLARRNLNPPPNMQPNQADAIIAVSFADFNQFINVLGMPSAEPLIQLA